MVFIPKGFISKGYYSEVFFISKGHYSEEFFIPKSHYSEFLTLREKTFRNKNVSKL